MIKCPNCGSGAQIELVWNDSDKYTGSHYKEYICGCGCHFVVTFEATKIQIIPEEKEE